MKISHDSRVQNNKNLDNKDIYAYSDSLENNNHDNLENPGAESNRDIGLLKSSTNTNKRKFEKNLCYLQLYLILVTQFWHKTVQMEADKSDKVPRSFKRNCYFEIEDFKHSTRGGYMYSY